MRIALVIPPVEDFYFTPQRASFLGIHTIADILVRHGIDHEVFNGIRANGKNIPLPAELDYLGHYLGRDLFFKSYRRFGITTEHLAARVKGFSPDYVLISCFAFCYAHHAIETANYIREMCPASTVVVGGAGVTVFPEYFLSRSSADYAAVGEVDGGLMDFLHGKAIPGNFMGTGSAGCTARAEVAGTECRFLPALVLTGESADTRYYSTMLTRGCPMRCSFCSVRLSFPVYRRAPVEVIKPLFDRIRYSTKKVHVNFEDDNLLYDKDHLCSALDLLDRATSGNFSFSMENGAEFRLLDCETIGLLKKYNIRQLNLPLVSVNSGILSVTGRRAGADAYAETVNACKTAGIPVTAYLIAGLPGETSDSVHSTLDFLEGLPVLPAVSIYYPVPGISGFEDPGIFDHTSPRLCSGMSLYPWNSCSTEELFDIFNRSRRMALSHA